MIVINFVGWHTSGCSRQGGAVPGEGNHQECRIFNVVVSWQYLQTISKYGTNTITEEEFIQKVRQRSS